MKEPPNATVLKQVEAARYIGLSLSTLKRLHREGTGPRRTQLSAHRVGYEIAALDEWIKALPEG